MTEIKLPFVLLSRMHVLGDEWGTVLSRHDTAMAARRANRAMQPPIREQRRGSYYPSVVVVVNEPVKVGEDVFESQIDEEASYDASIEL